MSEIESLIDQLLNEETLIAAIAIIGKDGNLITQTENWDVSSDLSLINELVRDNPELGQRGVTNITIQGVRYMVVENTEERKIGTNIKGQGHLIVCPIPIGGTGALVCYIVPEAGPRDALLNVQEYAQKLISLV